MSTDAPIPDDVRRFVLTSVPSVSYLEAMLVFHRERDRPRSAPEMARLLYVTEDVANDLLGTLAGAGVIAPLDDGSGRFRYAPADDRLASLIDQLAVVYSTHLVDVTNLIHDRTRRTAIQFADAFKLRKD
jgi:hypothetical protein